MKIISMQIENVLGIREFKLDAGQITEISGRNAEGKTSVLTALQTAIGGGSLAELKNINAGENDKARIVLAMRDSNGTNYVLDKTESGLKLKKQVGDSAAFETVGRPQAFLNDIRDCKLQNPIDFLNAKNDKDRTELILQAIDLPFDCDELWQAIGLDRKEFGFIADGMNPLEEIAQTRKMVFEKRTGVNVSRKNKRAACEEERRSVPAEIPTVDGIAEKEKELSELRLKRQELKGDALEKRKLSISRIESDYSTEENRCKNEMESFISDEEKQLEIEIAKLRESMRDRIEMKRSRLSTSMNDAEETKNKGIASADHKYHSDMEAIEELAPEIERLTGEIAEMREQEKNAVRIATIHDRANMMEQEAEELDKLSDTLTSSLKAIDDYKASMTSNLPVPGLDVTGNVVTINGVKWEHLNTAQKIIASVQIIAARARKHEFKFCVVDGVESLDSDSQKILIDTLLSNDIQAVLGKVADHDLEVRK